MHSWASPNLVETLGEIIETAIALTGADFGNVQLLDAEGRLRIVAQRNFPAWWIRYWETEGQGQGTCGVALEIQRRAGVRAVHSILFLGKQGRLLGVFSTHYRVPHTPAANTLKVLDLLACHAGTLAEHARDEHLLRHSETHLSKMLVLLEAVMHAVSPDAHSNPSRLSAGARLDQRPIAI